MSSYRIGDRLEFGYTGVMQYVELPRGIYLMEAWGAQGGSISSSAGKGGAGAYAKGTLQVVENAEICCVCVGGAGVTWNSTAMGCAGYNGGGRAGCSGGGGGGATDFRRKEKDLSSRFLVAAGGGGAQGRNSSTYLADGGYGGTAQGGDGGYYNGRSTTVYNGKGASRFAGGACGVYDYEPATAGEFGKGGNAGYNRNYGNGGGGGGYYGGGGGACQYAGGGGGSSWVSDQLRNVLQIPGNSSMTLPNGTNAVGNAGNGYGRITVLDLPPEPPQGLRVTGTTPTTVSLAWTAGGGQLGYFIYRDGVKLNQTPCQTTTYIDRTVLPLNTYRYEVSAVQDNWEGHCGMMVQGVTGLPTALQITVVAVMPNPVMANQTFTIQVAALDQDMLLYRSSFWSGSCYAGEELQLNKKTEAMN